MYLKFGLSLQHFFQAQMVKLVDTLVSGTSDRKVVQVRVLFWAPQGNQIKANALKSNDLGVFAFGEYIKKLLKYACLKRQNRDTHFLMLSVSR